MNFELVDIGSNLTHESFSADLDAVVTRAIGAGVRRQIVTGADLASSRAAASLTELYPGRLWSTAGVHPHHAHSFDPAQRAGILELLERGAVAVGECGLDYYRNFSSPDAQRAAFVGQLEIATAARKPVFLHQRDAHADFTDILRQFGAQLRGGVAHCFTGGVRELDVYLELGLYIGVTGWVCDERRGDQLRQAVPRIPIDRIMLETDAPYLLPRDLRGIKSRRNEPAFLPHIARTVADLRGISAEALAAASTQNAVALFALGAATD